MNTTIDRKHQTTINSLVKLLKKRNITCLSGLIRACRNDDEFKREWLFIWKECAKNNGGKLGLGTIGAIIGSSLGGVGIAMMGTAFGAQLAVVLGLGGLLSGSYLDSKRLFSKDKTIKSRVSPELYQKLKHDAEYLDVDLEQLVIVMIHSFYERDEARVSPVNIETI